MAVGSKAGFGTALLLGHARITEVAQNVSSATLVAPMASEKQNSNELCR